MELNKWAEEIHANSVKHGWWEADRPFAEVAMLVTCEVAEAVEEARAGRPMHYIEDGKPEGIAVEMADALIRILDWFGKEGLDVEAIVREKHDYNKGRPYKHGKKF